VTYWSKITKFLYPTPVFSASAGGDPDRNFTKMFLILIKLEWLCYRVVKKLWQYVKAFPQNTGTWRTDRIAISILRVTALTRNKKACLLVHEGSHNRTSDMGSSITVNVASAVEQWHTVGVICESTVKPQWIDATFP